MKKINTGTEDQLLDYLDGKLSPADREALIGRLETDADLRKRFELLQRVHEGLKIIKNPEPSKNFTSRVMQKLDQYPLQSGPSILNGLFILAGILIAITTVVFLMSKGVFNDAATLNLQSIELSKKIIPTDIPTINVNGTVLINGIIIACLVVAFAVLDRAVLKPYFRKRLTY